MECEKRESHVRRKVATKNRLAVTPHPYARRSQASPAELSGVSYPTVKCLNAK